MDNCRETLAKILWSKCLGEQTGDGAANRDIYPEKFETRKKPGKN